MKIRIAVIFGGKSVEHEVSVISGIQAVMNIDKEKYDVIPVYMSKNNEMFIGNDIAQIELYRDIKNLLKRSQRVIIVNEGNNVFLVPYSGKAIFRKKAEIDIVFPIVHGTNVEDGTLQGYLKTIGVPFVGCDVTASAVGMDKYIMKKVLKDNNIPILECKYFTKEDYSQIKIMIEKIEKTMKYPVIVKPINLGSSVGISVAKNRMELVKAIDDAFIYARRIIVEPAISELKEINCAVLGNETEAIASECEEPLHSKDILSYEDKYMNGKKNSGLKGMHGASRKIPADLSDEMKKEIQSLAINAFKCLGCNGVSRIDFMIDMKTSKLYLNEINTIPGSLSFYLWEPIGIPYSELLDRMIQLALKRSREENSIVYSFDTNILNQQSLLGAKGEKLS